MARIQIQRNSIPSTGGTITGTNTFDAGSSATDNARLLLISRQKWTNPTHKGDLIRLRWAGNEYKAAMSWQDENGLNKGAWVGHKYLNYDNPTKLKTFADAAISGGLLNITSHGFSTGDSAWFYSTYKTDGNLPFGLRAYVRYYVRAITTNQLSVHRSQSEANAGTNAFTLTTPATGFTHTIDGSNIHNHVSFETNHSDDSLHTKFAINYDLDTTIIRFTETDVEISGRPLIIYGEDASNRDIVFGRGSASLEKRFALRLNSTAESGSSVGADFQIIRYDDNGSAVDSPFTITRSSGLVTIASNLTVGGTGNGTFIINRNSTSNFASATFKTGSTDQWTIGLRTTAPTGDLHVRDNVNGRNLLTFHQSTGALILSEVAADPTASSLSSGSNAKDRLGFYMKNDKLVFAYNNAGTVTYLSIPLDGTTATWTHSTTAP